MEPATATAAPPRPLVTANQVTVARLALLPLGGWLMYQGFPWLWVAFFFLIVLGCTDFVDGILARRYGPTVLGGLMDPIADKVFVAIVFFPMTDPALGWLSPPLVGALMVREFVVTAARTSYQRRGITLRSSYLAKVKTWEQMSATAFFFLAQVLPSRGWLIGIVAVLAVAPLIAAGVVYALRRRWWRGAFVFCGSFVTLTVLAVLVDMRTFSLYLLIGTVALTWLTGGSYLSDLGTMVRVRPFDGIDLSRALGAVTLPIAATALIGGGYAAPWAVIGVVCLEFAMGGLDNLLTHDGAIQSGLAWGARTLTEAVLLGAAFWLGHRGDAFAAHALAHVAFGIAVIFVGLAFWRHRDAYLGARA